MSPDEHSNVSKLGKNLYKQNDNNYGWIKHKFLINLGAKRKGVELPKLLVCENMFVNVQ